jgi:P4 family phage/plasmid primase-like protien
MESKIIELPQQAEQPNEATETSRTYKPDDDQLAIQLAETWSGKAAYFHNDWHIYETGMWAKRDMHELKRGIRRFLRGYRHDGIKVSQRQINSLADMMEDECYIPDRAITSYENHQNKYINLRNGMFNLETFQLEPHNRDLYFTHQLDFDYDPDADCPHFRNYLNDMLVFPNGKTDFSLVALTQQALAYSMTARNDLKASFWLVGKPNAGKSTFLAFFRELMGSLHGTIDLNQLQTNQFLLADIVGKRVITCTEGSRNSIVPDWIYKTMVGGTDAIYANVKNKQPIQFVPKAKIWWGMNEMPRISDRSGATFNRLFIIPFNRPLPKSKWIQDLHLILLKEAPGIFNDIMIHYQRLCRSGQFDECEQSLRLRQEYQHENDTEAIFLDECFDRDVNGRIQVGTMTSMYRSWCIENGYATKTRSNLDVDLKRLGVIKEEHQHNGRYHWRGVKLKPENLTR